MINIKVKNLKGISKVRQKVQNMKEAKRIEYEHKIAQAVIILDQILKSKLNDALGSKFKYFDINVKAGATGPMVSITSKSAIGNYIYYGTKEHDIISDTPMPMPDGGFAMSVHHPGTDGMKEQFDAAVNASLYEMRRVMKL